MHRTIALVADDLNLSFESVALVRRALRKFIDTQMGSGDIVSIARTSAGLGMLQTFTNDRRELLAAVDALHWNPNGSAGLHPFAPIVPLVKPPGPANRGPVGPMTIGVVPPSPSPADLDSGLPYSVSAQLSQTQLYEQEQRRYEYARGALGSLTSMIKGLGEMLGRKAIILFSDGVPLHMRGGQEDDVQRFLHFVADAANRSSVVLNCVDARGLVSTALTAQDNPGDDARDNGVADLETTRREGFNASQDGLSFLANQTGGRVILNNNDLSWAVDRVLDDLSGYYLLGYKPQPGTFHKNGDIPQFHRLSVRLKRPGLQVRSRKGFYGVTDAEARPRPVTGVDRVRQALQSSFAVNGIPLHLTCEFESDGPRHSQILTLLRVDARSVTFEHQPDGLNHARLAILITGHDQDGRPVEITSHAVEVGLTEPQHLAALEAGLVFSETVPVSRSGSAHVRAAVLDFGSGRVGATSDFVLLPDLKKKRLALTALTVGNLGAAIGLEHAAVRIFKPGQAVPYRFYLSNPRVERGDRFARIETQVRLFHGGQLIWSGPASHGESRVGDTRELMVQGKLQLGDGAAPGDYYLQVIARDLQAGKRAQPATQWIDFALAR